MYKIYERYEKTFNALFLLIPYFLLFSCWDGLFRDSDNYTHAVRVLDFLKSGVWAEQPFVHSNYPKGEILNFTRIVDMLWTLCALPFMPFYSLKESVFFGGVLMQPCVAILTAWAITVQLKPYFGAIARLFGLIFFFLLQAILQIYMFARPDHHTIVICLGCWQLACFLIYIKERKIIYMKLAGVLGGLLLWVTIEGILFSYAVAASWVLLWIFGQEDLKSVKTFMLFAFVGSLVFLLLNPPYEGLLFLDNGRLSVLPVTAFGFSALAFYIADLSCFHSVMQKNSSRFGAIVFLTIVFSLLFLAVFGGWNVVFAPYFPSSIRNRWLLSVGEFFPANHSGLAFASFALPSIFAFLFGVCAFKSASFQERKGLILTLIPLFFFFLLTLKHIRFSENAAVFSVFPVVLFWNNFITEGKKERSKFDGVILFSAFCFGVLYLSVCLLQTQEAYSHHQHSVYGLERIVPYLSDFEKDGSLLVYPSQGSETIWSTERFVIGTPNHRNIEGVVDSHALLYGKDRNKVIDLLNKHSVRGVLLTDEQKPTGVLLSLECVQKIENTPEKLVLYRVNLATCR